ncbi:hypothetical protein [Silvimonas amylolytica]|uniref:Uncharacterized protein n=1 Tax=Silvimonas amylolytica TaxID=449663 RepID=A0ABQ2PGS3_9NEIS|nr:hypothetical protein [Silvimonas amylolytica]GGP24807.1 hypothetical protein GCM10010971_06260 [Silvimonas amylolytica]
MSTSHFARLANALAITFAKPEPFSEDKEKSFMAEYAATHLWGRRAGLLIALATWTAFAYWDFYVRKHYPTVFTENIFQSVLLIRFLAVPVLLAALVFSWTSHFRHEKTASLILLTISILSGFGIMAMMVITPAPLNYEYYFVGVMLVISFVFGIANLQTGPLRVFISALFAALIVQEAAFNTLGVYFFPAIFYFVFFCLTGWVVGVKMERNARDHFEAFFSLQQKHRHLEQHVAEQNAALAKNIIGDASGFLNNPSGGVPG